MLQAIELSGVIAFALYGISRAHQKQMDLVGLFSVAFIVSFGGGTLRDLCLDRHPLFWIAHSHYIILIFALALLGSIRPDWVTRLEKYLAIPDALGLGLFSIAGAATALEANVPTVIAALLAVFTGTFGGVLGDVVCNEIPSLFRSSPMYASCAFVGAWLYLGLNWLNVADAISLWVGVVSIALMRLAALRWNLRLPIAAS